MAINFVQKTFTDNSSTEPISAANLNALEAAVKILSDAYDPGIRWKVLTGTTGSTQGSTTLIAHGLTATNVLFSGCMVEYSPGGNYVFPDSSAAGYVYSFNVETDNARITLSASSSSLILSVPIKVLIFYSV